MVILGPTGILCLPQATSPFNSDCTFKLYFPKCCQKLPDCDAPEFFDLLLGADPLFQTIRNVDDFPTDFSLGLPNLICTSEIKQNPSVFFLIGRYLTLVIWIMACVEDFVVISIICIFVGRYNYRKEECITKSISLFRKLKYPGCSVHGICLPQQHSLTLRCLPDSGELSFAFFHPRFSPI